MHTKQSKMIITYKPTTIIILTNAVHVSHVHSTVKIIHMRTHDHELLEYN